MRSQSVGSIVKDKHTIEASFCPFSLPLPAVLLSCLHSLLIYCIVLTFLPALTFLFPFLILRICGSQNQQAHDLAMFYDV